MYWVLILLWSLLVPADRLTPRWPLAPDRPPIVPSAGPGMPCHPYRLSQIRQQGWATYSCLETKGYTAGLRTEAFDGHEQVYLRLRDGDTEMSAFWPAAKGKLIEGQYVKVKAMYVPLVRGQSVIGWGLLIIHWEPILPPVAGAKEG